MLLIRIYISEAIGDVVENKQEVGASGYYSLEQINELREQGVKFTPVSEAVLDTYELHEFLHS